MSIAVEPITGEEMVGYMAAMLSDGPLGEPETSLDELTEAAQAVAG